MRSKRTNERNGKHITQAQMSVALNTKIRTDQIEHPMLVKIANFSYLLY